VILSRRRGCRVALDQARPHLGLADSVQTAGIVWGPPMKSLLAPQLDLLGDI